MSLTTSERREIKLKAWDNDKKEFVKFGVGKHTYGYGPHCVPEFRTSEDGTELILQTNLYYARDWNITWIRPTGLKDKNGKEIFEGDVVNYDHPLDGKLLTVIEWHKHGIPSFVVRYTVKQFCDYDFDFMNATGEQYEVIGNIYSNPELLLKP